jgi:Cu/Ag efflux pump CusA
MNDLSNLALQSQKISEVTANLSPNNDIHDRFSSDSLVGKLSKKLNKMKGLKEEKAETGITLVRFRKTTGKLNLS